MKILQFILSLFSTKEILSVVNSALSCLKDYFQYRKTDMEVKKEEKEERRNSEYDEKIRDITDKGDIQDLINLKK